MMESSGMTISAALRRVKALKGIMSTTRARNLDAANYNLEAPPVFSYNETLDEYKRASRELVGLQSAIQVANATHTVFFKGREVPLCWAICQIAEIKSRQATITAIKSHAEKEFQIVDSSKYRSWINDTMMDLRRSDEWYKLSHAQKTEATRAITNMPEDALPEYNRTITSHHVCELPLREKEKKLQALRDQFAELNGLLEKANHTVTVRSISEQ